MAVNDARLVQVVRGHFNVHFVADGNPDEIFAHFA
jgi:murein tripeptide amidase MpaA